MLHHLPLHTMIIQVAIGGNRGSLEKVFKQTFETALDCIRTNYYGTKLVSKELIPLLQLSNSARIINVSSSLGQLKVQYYDIVRECILKKLVFFK
jgi:short-subunit dehydrogenase involved in D-alanine esterification of teichoic acids